MHKHLLKKTIKVICQVIPFLSLRIKLLRFIGYNIGQDVYPQTLI